MNELLLPKYDAAGNVVFGEQAQEFNGKSGVVIQVRNLPVLDDDGYTTTDIVPHLMFFRACAGRVRNCSISMNDAWQCVPSVAGSSDLLIEHATSVAEELWQNMHTKNEVYAIADFIQKFMSDFMGHKNEDPKHEQSAQQEAMAKAGLKLVVNNEVIIDANNN